MTFLLLFLDLFDHKIRLLQISRDLVRGYLVLYFFLFPVNSVQAGRE